MNGNTFASGSWALVAGSRAPCQVISKESVFGQTTYQVWLPENRELRLLPASLLLAISEDAVAPSLDAIRYVAAAARITEALATDALVAPVEGKLIPLPHQLYALSRVMSGDKVRYLLADEVGLGKTIEAGLVMRELKLRGRAKRILVIAPTGLVTQWVQEMQTHFDEKLHLVIPGDFAAVRGMLGIDERENLWRLHDQVVTPLDSVKPLDSRRGWTREQVDRYNRERFQDLVAAGWDLIVIDESHRLGGSTDAVARYRLGEALATASGALLLLSATPHQGKTDQFRRLMALLDPDAFVDESDIRKEKVAPYVIRTEKRHAIDTEGRPLFQPRHVQLRSVPWNHQNPDQQVLYDGVTDYVRKGYNQALREGNYTASFLMILMQRLVSSSTRAIKAALEKRLDVVEGTRVVQPSFFGVELDPSAFDSLESPALMDRLVEAKLKGVKDERAQVMRLLSLARRVEATAPDAKAKALLDLIYEIQQAENDPAVKLLIFTEFVPTQQMLADFLGNRGFKVTCLNGSLNVEERKDVQQAFREGAQILISTDAGGEGLNLQFCHVVINFDLPWNPMKLEQRIGRVDRIGQKHLVRAVNFALEESVELRVREVLEEKLARILEEFGVDKLGDVLDSEATDVNFDDVYMAAVMDPDTALAQVDSLVADLRAKAAATVAASSLLGAETEHDPEAAQRIAYHQVPFWTEQMTLSYLRDHQTEGGRIESVGAAYRLTFPGGDQTEPVVFDRKAADDRADLITLEDPRIRKLLDAMTPSTPGMPIPGAILPGISNLVTGTFALWQVTLESPADTRRRIFPLFRSDDGRILRPTATRTWDLLLDVAGAGIPYRRADLTGEPARALREELRQSAEQVGAELYTVIQREHEATLAREEQTRTEAFQSRRREIERIGLPQVRQYRLQRLELERQAWELEIASKRNAWPALEPLLLLRILAEGEVTG
ncbi:MAG TPA: helicase-related protein [Symbiobacteriaceae bacterium]|nr:helicase-related protein [Symbiobacteriaceae bacterium]